MAFIYVITNNVNGKQYVGKTVYSIEKRFQEHKNDSMKRRCEKRPLYAAMRKYGIEHFTIDVLEICSAEQMSDREKYWINELHTYGHTGYNATYGGEGKPLYDYKKIAEKYLQLQNQIRTAEYFHCDITTVRAACKEYNVTILSSQQITKNRAGKSIRMLPDDIMFPSISDGVRYLQENGYTQSDNRRGISAHIRRAIKTGIKAYGKNWELVEK